MSTDQITPDRPGTSFSERALGDAGNPLEEIDAIFEHAPVRLWLAVGGLALLIAALVGWAVVADQVVTIAAPATIVPPSGLVPVSAPVAGLVGPEVVSPGTPVRDGQLLATIETAEGPVPVTAPTDGSIVSVEVVPGRPLAAGGLLVTMATDETPMAIAVLDGAALGRVRVGQPATVAVAGLDPTEDGELRATVAWISPLPASAARLTALFGAAAATAFPAGSVYEARLALQPADTPTGFAWTVGNGPSAGQDRTGEPGAQEQLLHLGAAALARIEIARQSLASKAFD